MANSSTVSSGEQATASQYNNLRDDVLSTTSGHLHDASNGRAHAEFTILAAEGDAAIFYMKADEGDDAGDEWKFNVADAGVMTIGNDIASAGTYVTHLTINPHATITSSSVTFPGILDVNGSVDWDVSDGQVDSSGDIDLVSTNDAAAAIYLRENAGTSGTIKIHSDQGTSVTEGAESINILSDAGGVGIRSTANLANAVNITVDGGTTSSMTLFNDQGTSATEGSASIQLLSDVGGINLKSGLNAANAILLTADGGTSEGILIHSDQGTGTGSIKLLSDAGGITFTAGADIELDATNDVNIPANVGLTFGNDAEKIEGDGTDLTISGNNINLTATADVVIPANVGVTFGSGEKIEGDSTDLTITSGAKINLTATSDVVIPANVGITFGSGEKIEGDSTDLTVTSGAKINLTATSDVHIPKNVGIVFDDNASEKIESNDTNLTINSGADINLTATSDINIPSGVGLTFGDDAEKIEGDGTDLTISGNIINLSGTVAPTGTIELGHASDTTIARSGSGAITVEGTQVLLAGAQTGVTTILNASTKIGRDTENLIDFATTDNKIIFRVNNVNEVELVENALSPVTSDGVALGTTSLMWSDLFVASGGVLNFNNGDVTVTHSSNTLTVAGGILAAPTNSTIGNLTLADGSITDSSGAIDFGNETLTTTGVVTAGGFTIGNAVIVESELEMIDGITAGTVAASKAVVVDSNKDAASFRNITLTGELDAATLDISGNADIDGTTNLDAVDIDGAVQIDGAVTIGVDDTGKDLKAYGASTGSFMLWDESEDDFILKGANLVIGHTAPVLPAGATPVYNQVGTTQNTASWGLTRYSANGSSPQIFIAKSRHGTIGTNAFPQDNDAAGSIHWMSGDATDDDLGIESAVIRVDHKANAAQNASTTDMAFWTANGATAAVALTLHANKNATLVGTLTESSDVALKTNINTIDSALNKVNQMRGVSYDRTDINVSGVGLVAQELEKIAPELVQDNEEYKSVSYTKLTAYLVEAIKELSNKVKDLEAK